jgi:hypothetical protein
MKRGDIVEVPTYGGISRSVKVAKVDGLFFAHRQCGDTRFWAVTYAPTGLCTQGYRTLAMAMAVMTQLNWSVKHRPAYWKCVSRKSYAYMREFKRLRELTRLARQGKCR